MFAFVNWWIGSVMFCFVFFFLPYCITKLNKFDIVNDICIGIAQKSYHFQLLHLHSCHFIRMRACCVSLSMWGHYRSTSCFHLIFETIYSCSCFMSEKQLNKKKKKTYISCHSNFCSILCYIGVSTMLSTSICELLQMFSMYTMFRFVHSIFSSVLMYELTLIHFFFFLFCRFFMSVIRFCCVFFPLSYSTCQRRLVVHCNAYAGKQNKNCWKKTRPILNTRQRKWQIKLTNAIINRMTWNSNLCGYVCVCVFILSRFLFQFWTLSWMGQLLSYFARFGNSRFVFEMILLYASYSRY